MVSFAYFIYLLIFFLNHFFTTLSGTNINILFNFLAFSKPNYIISNMLPTKEGFYPRNNYLLNTPLFAKRTQFIDFKGNFSISRRYIKFSVVIATHERTECLKRVFDKLIKFRPVNTEIIISDDSSKSKQKQTLLNQISNDYKDDDVYVIVHTQSFGSFHTKLDGYLFSVGDFIMSIDDDDTFENQFYIELASTTIKSLINNKALNFIIPLDFPYIKKWVKLPVNLTQMISGFHNHVNMAFRRILISNVDYPPHEVEILRDDAPLMIPLYMQTNNSQILYFENKHRYVVDHFCQTSHQVSKISQDRKKYLNGYYFLIRYMKTINRFDFEPFINAAYKVS